ncbi:MAG: hypothetical protein ACJ797_23115 [Ktedonobacteraceae bacterium]
MAMTERSTVVGVFTDPGLADVAIEELVGAGFRDDQISLSRHEDTDSDVSFIGRIDSLLSGLKDSDRSIVERLVSMGVPEEEARYYQGELELGRSIVTVEAGDRREDAIEILRSNGGYDSTTRHGA